VSFLYRGCRNVVSMGFEYLQSAKDIPLRPNPIRRYVFTLDTSATLIASTFCLALPLRKYCHPPRCTSITTLLSCNGTAAPASCSSLRWWTSSLPLRRRSDECEVYLYGLIQQLGIMRPINRSSSLVQRWVFDERIALTTMID
jgi:hypothetical protein